MTNPIWRDLPNRCPNCGLETVVMGHRSHFDGAPTGCTPSGPLGLILARQRRDSGMQATTEAHPDDAARVDAVLAARIRRGGEFSLNDLRHELADVKSRNVIGARVQALARSRQIVRIGYEPSTDVGTNGHPIARWRVAA